MALTVVIVARSFIGEFLGEAVGHGLLHQLLQVTKFKTGFNGPAEEAAVGGNKIQEILHRVVEDGGWKSERNFPEANSFLCSAVDGIC